MRKGDRLIACNREWTGITVTTKNGKRVFLDYSQIQEIRIGYYTITKLFSKKTTEKIEIVVKGAKKPIILTKLMDWDNFEQYKKEISKFATDNKIPIVTGD
ncbi:MAG TPA: hypothetical protein DCE02_03095 [Ruminiclostridium sp.]|uniref:PH domain-containing protein n=2 Tax=Acetivibrio saccincola TaxID=1677857 RepID=A0A2K9EQ50_9FIRM|nr:hypothetical protein [Acetivibrio saccincola]AUG57630.1 hypothetical protein HVS_08610 [Acetivibrio saccincola]NLW26828.1 hypothetical protein [Acetivibrio saccincola]PQQ67529.1 hypothetical protein B9R14_12745 [Acetivibrio saccincola]HAA42980.1 hypothetical protein [Ruminiclostridium sp.]